MVDDKDDSAADPWAGIEEDGGGQAADGFSFSFDASSEVDDNPFAPPPQEPAAASVSPEHDATDAPIFPIDTTLEGHAAPESDADPFASLSIDAADTADGADEIAGWLSEPLEDSGSEPPLAVFPAGDVEPLEEPPLAAEAFPDTPVAFESSMDDLHAFAEPEQTAIGGSSQVEVGTGFSGIVSPSEVDPASDGLPGDDWPEAATTDNTLDDFATDDQPSFDASGFDGVSDVGEVQPDQEGHDLAGAPAVAASAAVAAASAARGRPAARKKGGGLGQLVGIVLGGLMAIPITYAILIWGFQKDPFKLAALVPEQVAFLLPQKFQPGFKAQAGARLDATSALDDLPATIDTTAAVEPAAEEPSAPPAAAVAADDAPPGDLATLTEPNAPAEAPHAAGPPMPVPSPAAAFDDIVAETPSKTPPEPAAPPEPEPLDLSALEAAVGEATASFETLAAADAEAPDRKKLLVGWYKRLAAVAEQLVLLEKIAADSGRDLDAASAVMDAVCGPIAMDAGLQADLTKLSGSWLTSKKRTADGAMLLATFESARQVGPYWSARVTIDGVEPQSVAVISRAEPRVDPGTRVLVSGVLFDGDVVWASDVRSLEKKAAKPEDLF